MFIGFLKIRNHDDVAQINECLRTKIATRFYEVDHFESEHLATPEEAREYLDLLLELAKTFPEGNPRFVRYNGACFVIVARLMSMAGIELSEYDKQHILDYTTVRYDSDYLNYACQIRDADLMIDQIGDFWRFVALKEFYLQKAERLSDQIDSTSRLRLIKRFCLGLEFAKQMDRADYNSSYLGHQYIPTMLKTINANYRSELKYAYPLIFYHRPTSVNEKLFETQEIENEARAEWESCDLHRKFSDEKLARLLDLEPGFKTEVNAYHPDTGEIIFAKYDERYKDRKEVILDTYPELEPYYYPYMAFDFFGRGEGCCSEPALRRIIRDLAGVFGAEKYLPMANYSWREQFPNGEHPEEKMSDGELAIANKTLSFVESAR